MPLWKSYEEIKRQDDIPGKYDIDTANYALKKYANSKQFEVVELEIIEKELEPYIPYVN